MTGTQLVGITCLILSLGLFVNGIYMVSGGRASEVANAVGGFLPAIMALVIGLWFLRKPKSS